DPPSDFRNDAIEAGRGEQIRHQSDGHLERRDIRRKIVRVADGAEGVETNLAGGLSVTHRGDANGYVVLCLGHGGAMVTKQSCSRRLFKNAKALSYFVIQST